MILKNLKELFTLKGLLTSMLMLAFGYAVGFVAGWIIEKVRGKEGARLPFIDLSIPNTAGLLLGVGGWVYMVWLLSEELRIEKKKARKL